METMPRDLEPERAVRRPVALAFAELLRLEFARAEPLEIRLDARTDLLGVAAAADFRRLVLAGAFLLVFERVDVDLREETLRRLAIFKSSWRLP
jgi:hypothetical protein